MGKERPYWVVLSKGGCIETADLDFRGDVACNASQRGNASAAFASESLCRGIEYMRQCVEFGPYVVEWPLLLAGAYVQCRSACNPQSREVHRINPRDCGGPRSTARTGNDHNPKRSVVQLEECLWGERL